MFTLREGLWGLPPSVRKTGMGVADFAAMQPTVPSPVGKLIKRHYRPLFYFARGLCDGPAQAMVLTQDTFRVAQDRSRGLPVPANDRAWLFGILLHKFLANRPPRGWA